jgi:nicotinamidase/pyrazinamidase
VQYNSHTALIVVDIQNDFADPKGSLYVRGGEGVVPVANREIAAARRAEAFVVFSQDWHPEITPHFQKDGGVWPVHCVRDSWGAAFVPGLDWQGAEVIRKGTGGEDGYSAFTVRDPTSGEPEATRLAQLLTDREIERVVVIGLATDYCVKDTALDALRLGYPTTVLTEAIRAVDLQPGDGDRALEAVRAAGGTVA